MAEWGEFDWAALFERSLAQKSKPRWEFVEMAPGEETEAVEEALSDILYMSNTHLGP